MSALHTEFVTQACMYMCKYVSGAAGGQAKRASLLVIISLVPSPLRKEGLVYTPSAHALKCTENPGISYNTIKYSVNYPLTITSLC